MPRLRSAWYNDASRAIAGSIWLNGARPDSSGPNLGLDDYTDRLLVKCLDVIQAETGEQSIFLTGHSLGGIFAAICAALHRQRVAGLILLGTPLHFGPHVGPLDRLVAASP